MFLLYSIVFLLCSVCASEDSDEYGLHIGNSIDVFANYGDLSQVTQVVSVDYKEDDDLEPIEPFSEKNIRVFKNATSSEVVGSTTLVMDILLCDTFEELLDKYFSSFSIEGTAKPWKSFMSDWVTDEIMRTFGVEYDPHPESCCYVLVKLTKMDRSVQLNDLTGVAIKESVRRAADALNVSNVLEIRRFMRSYGTHYIDSYVTGNFIYQVFKYKRIGYSLLKSYIKSRLRQTGPDNLRFYFSSYFLKEVGEIRIASGNKVAEQWARRNLRDSQYLYSRPSLLRLHYNNNLAYKLNNLLDNGALLGLGLKILRPVFRDRVRGEKFAEIVDNDMKLWEVNS